MANNSNVTITAAGTLALTASSTGLSSALPLTLTNNAVSSSITSGALIVTGGAGIGGNTYVGGNLVVSGNVTYAGTITETTTTVLNVADPLIYLAQNNGANINDIGIVGHFTASPTGYQHTGLVRQASSNTWMLFSGDTTEPSTTITTTDSTFQYDPIKTGTLTTSGSVRFTNTGGANTNYVGFVGPSSAAANVTWTLPNADAGTAGFALVSNGAGVLSWAAAGAVITTDTTTTTLYPAMSTSNTGNFTAAKVNSNLILSLIHI